LEGGKGMNNNNKALHDYVPKKKDKVFKKS